MKNLRVYIDKNKHETYEKLVKKGSENPDNFPFQTMKDLFILAMCLGVKNKAYDPLTSKDDIFNSDVFDEKTEIPVMQAIAFAKENSLEILLNERAVLDIAQVYANGGINYVIEEIIKNPGKPLNNLSTLIMMHK